jgi:hypothetical protein
MPSSKDISGRENNRLSPSPDEIYRDSIAGHTPDEEEYVPKTKLDSLADKIHPRYFACCGWAVVYIFFLALLFAALVVSALVLRGSGVEGPGEKDTAPIETPAEE